MLESLGQDPRDIDHLEQTLMYVQPCTITPYSFHLLSSMCCRYYAICRQAGLASNRPGSRDTLAAHHLDLGEEEDDGNFGVLSSMGLLSRSGRGDTDNANEISLYDESEHGANAELDGEEQDYVDLKDLLKEIDDVVVDTSVTASDMEYWQVKGSEKVFVDYWIEIESDESAFDSTVGKVRRSHADLKWLHEALQAELEMEPPEELVEEFEVTDDPDPVDAMDHLDDIGQYLTAIAEDPEFQVSKAFQKFLSDDAIEGVDRPTAFTCVALEEGDMDRNTLAAYPVESHLNAIAAYHEVDISGCHNSFECADKILQYVDLGRFRCSTFKSSNMPSSFQILAPRSP